MKKLFIFIAINLCVFFGFLVLTGQAGAKDCITLQIPCPEQLRYWDQTQKCRWEYKYIDAGEKIPEGWEPFGVTTTFDYDQKGIAEYRLWANRHIIWLRKRIYKGLNICPECGWPINRLGIDIYPHSGTTPHPFNRPHHWPPPAPTRPQDMR